MPFKTNHAMKKPAPFAQILEEWRFFYQDDELNVDLAKVPIPPKPKNGNWLLLFIRENPDSVYAIWVSRGDLNNPWLIMAKKDGSPSAQGFTALEIEIFEKKCTEYYKHLSDLIEGTFNLEPLKKDMEVLLSTNWNNPELVTVWRDEHGQGKITIDRLNKLEEELDTETESSKWNASSFAWGALAASIALVIIYVFFL